MLTHLFAIAPASVSWSPKVALVMILCNVVAIMVGKATIKHPNVGAALPNASFFGGMGHAALLGTTSLATSLALAPSKVWPPAACSEAHPLREEPVSSLKQPLAQSRYGSRRRP